MHHSARGSQHLSFRHTSRLIAFGIEPSVGSRGDSYDNALAESIIGLYRTEVVRRSDRSATYRPSGMKRRFTPGPVAIPPCLRSQKRASSKPGPIQFRVSIARSVRFCPPLTRPPPAPA